MPDAVKQILIVEDDRHEYDLLAGYLRDLGHEVSGFTPDFNTAVEHLSKTRFSNALLDIDLRGKKNGLLLAERIRKEHPDLHLLFISNHTDQDVLRSAGRLSPIFVAKSNGHHLEQIKVQLTLSELISTRRTSAPKESILVLPFFTLNNYMARQDGDEESRVDPRTLSQHVVRYDDIFYIGKDRHQKDYLHLKTVQGKSFNHTLSLQAIERLLPDSFGRIEKGTIVNYDYLSRRINGRHLEIHGQEFVVGKSYLEEVSHRISLMLD